jgi:hypothetical protein
VLRQLTGSSVTCGIARGSQHALVHKAVHQYLVVAAAARNVRQNTEKTAGRDARGFG